MLAAMSCEHCGYDRTGIGDGPCPECGVTPGAIAADRAAAGADRGWVGSVIFGIVLLGVGSVAALDVVVTGGFDGGWRGRGVVPQAVGVPGPRVWAGPMLQRSIGYVPGPLGTRGTQATAATVIGALLVTRRHRDDRRRSWVQRGGWGLLLLDLRRALRRAAVSLRSPGVVGCRRIGVVLLIGGSVWALAAGLRVDFRHGLLTNLPLTNWPGPKVAAAMLTADFPNQWRWGLPSVALPLLLTGAGVWLMTVGGTGPLRAATRWGTIAVLGAAVGMRLTDSPLPTVSPYTARTVQLVALIEIPATVLLYLHVGRPKLAAVAGTLIALPLLAIVLSGQTWQHHGGPAATLAAATYGAAAAATSAWAAVALFRWANPLASEDAVVR